MNKKNQKSKKILDVEDKAETIIFIFKNEIHEKYKEELEKRMYGVTEALELEHYDVATYLKYKEFMPKLADAKVPELFMLDFCGDPEVVAPWPLGYYMTKYKSGKIRITIMNNSDLFIEKVPEFDPMVG